MPRAAQAEALSAAACFKSLSFIHRSMSFPFCFNGNTRSIKHDFYRAAFICAVKRDAVFCEQRKRFAVWVTIIVARSGRYDGNFRRNSREERFR